MKQKTVSLKIKGKSEDIDCFLNYLEKKLLVVVTSEKIPSDEVGNVHLYVTVGVN